MVSKVDDVVNTVAKDIFLGISDELAYTLCDILHLPLRVNHKQEAVEGLQQNDHISEKA
jgi:hypothetical protein